MKIENKDLLDRIFSKSSIVDYSHFIKHSLYDDKYGYYKNKDISKDFFTSPITHDSFGKIISKQLKDVWDHYSKPRQFIIVELGGNSGKLKEDILSSISKNKKFFNSVIYLNIDEINGENLVDIEFEAELGCIVSNEFFDALPFNRYLKDGESIKELLVKFDNGKLVEATNKIKDFKFLSNDVTSNIPDGSTFEVIQENHETLFAYWRRDDENLLIVHNLSDNENTLFIDAPVPLRIEISNYQDSPEGRMRHLPLRPWESIIYKAY